MANITEEKFNKYYSAMKGLYLLHRAYNFGKSPDIPSGFSESLGRHLLSASKGEDRTHDAICPNGSCIEIKATGTNAGKTTISNSNRFDVLVWMSFDFEKDMVHLYEMPYVIFAITSGTGRRSISLGTLAKKENILPKSYQFLIDGIDGSTGTVTESRT